MNFLLEGAGKPNEKKLLQFVQLCFNRLNDLAD